MRKTFWIIGIALLFGWFGPTRAQADDITVISVNNLTVDGTSTCGPSSTSLCTVSISSNIEWDNTTDSIVGSPSTTTETNTGSGPYTLCVTAACVKFDAGAFDDTFTLFWSSPSEEIIYSTIMYAPPYLTPSSTAGIYANSECYLSKGGCASDFFSGPQ